MCTLFSDEKRQTTAGTAAKLKRKKSIKTGIIQLLLCANCFVEEEKPKGAIIELSGDGSSACTRVRK